MPLIAFVIKDLKNPNFGIPMFFRSPQDLRRHIATNMLRDPDALAAMFPADYEVWAIGEWDETAGRLEVYPENEHVCSMIEIHQLAQQAAVNRPVKAQKGVENAVK